MKITYFRIKGYINILNGMGLDELIIPFLEFKNRIILVSGENGTGKSTIIKALTPNPDSSDSFRTDVFIDQNGNRQIIEYPGEKEIHYLDYDENGNSIIYKILIQSLVDESRTRRTTKAFISKNDEELNPNGNVSSFKDIRDDLLGIDPVYLDLSFVSSEQRGIVDMIPSERRKYMASYIGSLDTYNNIYKIISKKVSNLKSYMNTLNNKIYEIGNENELRLKQIQLNNQLSDYNTQRDNIITDLSEAETTVKLIDPDNKMQDLYQSISDRLTAINLEMEKNKSILDRLYSKLGLIPQNQDLNLLLKNTEDQLFEYNKNLDFNKTEISSLLSLNQLTNNTLEENKTRLSNLSRQEVQINIEEAVDQVSKEVDLYSSYLKKSEIDILETVSMSELKDLKSDLDKFLLDLSILEESYDESNIKEALNYYREESTIKIELDNWNKEVSDISAYIISTEKDLERYREDLETLKEFGSTRPSNCNIDTCPYIVKYIRIQESIKSEEEISKIEQELSDSKIRLSNLNIRIKSATIILEIINKLKSILVISNKSILTKINKLSFMIDLDKLFIRISNHNRFPEFSIVDDLIEKKSIYDNFSKLKLQLKEMESDLRVYKANKLMIDSLTESITKLEAEYSEREEKIKSLSKDCTFLDGVITETFNTIENLRTLINTEEKISNLNNEKSNLRDEFNSVKDKISLVKEKVDSVNTLKQKLSMIDQEIEPLRGTINAIEYSLTNIVNYQQEYKTSSELYDKMVFIRNACSPGNGMGIQSEYIKRYMSDIIIDCNRMLAYMFGGNIQLDVPIINEKQFSIPFIGPGGIGVPDISNGSTAQKCMIGLVFSSVAMMKSSLKYNIPRYDEIDAGLDQGNRITFIQVLNQVLDIMHSEQCVICSHNVEFDTQSTTRIICSSKGVRFEQ